MGPTPPAAFVEVADQAFARMLAACGVPPAMFVGTADGTAQREGLRRWHMNVVLPVARILEDELRRRLEVDVRLKFDVYAMDIAGRAGAFRQFVSQGMDIDRGAGADGTVDGGLRMPYFKRWEPWEDQIVLNGDRSAASDTTIARKLCRTPKAVLVRRTRIAPLGRPCETMDGRAGQGGDGALGAIQRILRQHRAHFAPCHGARRLPREAAGFDVGEMNKFLGKRKTLFSQKPEAG